MNWLLIVVAVLLLFCMVTGYKKGLLKQGLILFGALILLWLMSFLLPYTRTAIKEHTPVEIMISERVERMLQNRIDEMAEEKRDETLAQFNIDQDKLPNGDINLPAAKIPALTKSQQTELIEKAQIPAFVKKILLEKNNSEIYDRLGVETFTDYVKTYVTELVVNILAYVTTFILSYMIYRLLLAAVHLVDHLPLAGSINHGLGAILGLAEGLVILGVFFMILLLFCRTDAGRACYKCIDSSKMLTFLYDYNPLMAIVSAVTG